MVHHYYYYYEFIKKKKIGQFIVIGFFKLSDIDVGICLQDLSGCDTNLKNNLFFSWEIIWMETTDVDCVAGTTS